MLEEYVEFCKIEKCIKAFNTLWNRNLLNDTALEYAYLIRVMNP